LASIISVAAAASAHDITEGTCSCGKCPTNSPGLLSRKSFVSKEKAPATDLYNACHAPNSPLPYVEYLIDKYPDQLTRKKGKFLRSAGYAAIKSGRSDLLKVLLDRGLNPLEAAADGETLLMSALRKCEYCCFRVLVENIQARPGLVEHINWKRSYDGVTALMLAAMDYGAIGEFEALLKLGASPYIQDFRGRTVFHWAFPTAVLALRNRWVPGTIPAHLLNVKDNDGNTALHIAAKTGSTGNIHLLLEMGASRDLLNKKGHAPADMPLVSRDTSQFIKNWAPIGVRLPQVVAVAIPVAAAAAATPAAVADVKMDDTTPSAAPSIPANVQTPN
jgi:hypothetical protein